MSAVFDGPDTSKDYDDLSQSYFGTSVKPAF